MRKKAENVARYWGTIRPASEMWGIDAWWGSQYGGFVQLCKLRGAGGGKPSAAGDPRDREFGAVGTVGGFRGAVRQAGTAIDPAEKLLRALLLQAFYSVRSERQLMEQLDYNLLFRWFVGLALDAPIWDVTVFTKNRERLVEREVAAKFMAAVLNQPRVKELLSAEHFSADGTLIEAWASMKSFRPKDGGGEPPAAGRNGERDFHGEKRSNETHASTTDADAWLYRKGPGQAAKLAYMGRVLMENRKVW